MTASKTTWITLSLTLCLGLSASAFSQTVQVTPQSAPAGTLAAPKSTLVDATIIDPGSPALRERVRTQVVNRQAPQVGQTRAAVEAIYGPPLISLAPNKEYKIYTNETELVDGKMFMRTLRPSHVKIYEVTYSKEASETATDKVTNVTLRTTPRIGDHKNLVTKMLGKPMGTNRIQDQQQLVFGIPRELYVFYNEVVSSPSDALNLFFNADGFLVGQEFLHQNTRGQYTLTSAGRYVQTYSNHQPDIKVAW